MLIFVFLTILQVFKRYILEDISSITSAPYPTRTIIPGTDLMFYDKIFTNELPNNNQQIHIQPKSNIKQISGCKFTDINGSYDYFLLLETEIQFFNNIIEYSDIDETYSVPINANYDGHFTLSDCTFSNAHCSKTPDDNANVFYCTKKN